MQNIKRMIKKISAISTGAAMLTMSMAGALAVADLNTYPAPFVDVNMKKFSYLGVVGTDSAAIDNIALTDIATSLSAVPVPGTSSGGTVTVAGGETDDIPIGLNIVGSNRLDAELQDDDISNLIDSSISFQGSDYDVSEVVHFGQSGVQNVSVQTALTASDDDYKDNVVVEVETDSLKYYYAFDESISVNATKSADPLEIKFLGKKLTITKVNSASKFTANVGAEYFLNIGDSVEVNGKKVTLDDVGSGGNIAVDVDGKKDLVGADITKTINGIEIKNDDTFYTDNKAERSAFLVIGKDATETYQDGDAYAGEDKDDPKWVWDIGNLQGSGTTTLTNNITGIITGSGPFIGIENDWRWVDGSDGPALTAGQCVDLPNNYVSLCYDSLTVKDDDYIDVTVELSEGVDLTSDSRVPGLSNANTLHIQSSKDDTLKLIRSNFGAPNLTGDVKTKELWVTGNSNASVFYKDKDNANKKTFAGNVSNQGGFFARIDFGDTKDTNVQINVSHRKWEDTGLTTNSEMLVLSLTPTADSSDDIAANTDGLFMQWNRTTTGVTQLGHTKSSEEAGELSWGSSLNGGTTIGTKDENHRTKYGIIIKDPKSQGASDKVVLKIPSDQVQVNIVVKPGTGSLISASGTSSGVAISTYATAPSAVLDSEVTTPADNNLILVGGPAVNKLSAQFLGKTYPAYGEDSGLKEGEAVLEIKENGANVALIVAGWAGEDTRRAAKVLQSYKAFSTQLKGASVKVAGTTSSPTIVTSA